MNTALIAYTFEDEPVRVMLIAGDPWFVANDLCRVLAIANSRDALGRLEPDEKGVGITDTLGGQQDMNIVSESGMYALIFTSRKAEAKRFRKWVTAEVLPSIRRTGRYELPGHEPSPALPLDHDTARLAASVAAVREARRLFGPSGARNIWLQLGLPQPLVDAEGTYAGDPWAEPVREWLRGRVETTAKEVAEGIGVRPIDFSARVRVRELLKLFGWQERVVRKGAETMKRWVPLAAVEMAS